MQARVLSCLRVLTTALVLFATLTVDLRGRQLLEIDGIELRGTAQLVQSGGGTCNVLEPDTSYEERKQNHGSPMDIWRLDFSVHNGSGRWLDHLIARYGIESEWPECTNWDGPDAGEFRQIVEWANSNGHIQESGRNVVAPGRTLTATHLFIVLRGDPQPRFSNWSMDFDFAVGPPPPSFGSATAPPQAVSAANPEQENIFWQSIVDSTNPAMFEAYLAQFPNGVFRALAEVRLAELRAPGSDLPAAKRLSAGTDSQPDPPFEPGPQPACKGQVEGAECWKELASHPGCHVWDNHYFADQTATWTGGCSGGLAEGSGTLKWVGGQIESEGTGVLRNGRPEARWVIHGGAWAIGEGPYVDGERHGDWVIRQTDGDVLEGPFVDGKKNGRWVERFATGTVYEGPYADGERHGYWVQHHADGDDWEGPYVDGERSGQWVERQADGDVAEGPWVKGERHGDWVIRRPDGTTETLTYIDGELQ